MHNVRNFAKFQSAQVEWLYIRTAASIQTVMIVYSMYWWDGGTHGICLHLLITIGTWCWTSAMLGYCRPINGESTYLRIAGSFLTCLRFLNVRNPGLSHLHPRSTYAMSARYRFRPISAYVFHLAIYHKPTKDLYLQALYVIAIQWLVVFSVLTCSCANAV